MNHGTLYIISAPSGTGKSSLIQALLKTQSLCNIKISISYTTRKIRPGEYNGKHYFFISKKLFLHMIKKNVFIEYAIVFGNYYGTSRTLIKKILSTGSDVFLDINWQGAKKIRSEISKVCSIFLLPPSKEELNRRLFHRKQDKKDIILERMTQAINDMIHYIEYDYLIINDNFNLTLFNLKTIIRAERLRLNYQLLINNNLINKLISI
ncbi:Guanylate kinase [Serratia symbiotica]|nr:Guanylate kinase [Serratia symbiotica]